MVIVYCNDRHTSAKPFFTLSQNVMQITHLDGFKREELTNLRKRPSMALGLSHECGISIFRDNVALNASCWGWAESRGEGILSSTPNYRLSRSIWLATAEGRMLDPWSDPDTLEPWSIFHEDPTPCKT